MNENADHPVSMEEVLRRIRELYAEEEHLKAERATRGIPAAASNAEL